MKHIKKYIISASLICLVMLLIGCNYQIVPKLKDVSEPEPVVKTRFFGDYETKEMRDIWGVCYTAFMRKNPYTPPEPVAAMCDCYVDQLRETYGRSELKGLSDNESKIMGKQLIAKCNGKPLGSAKKMNGDEKLQEPYEISY
jgi:hypothetical protein